MVMLFGEYIWKTKGIMQGTKRKISVLISCLRNWTLTYPEFKNLKMHFWTKVTFRTPPVAIKNDNPVLRYDNQKIVVSVFSYKKAFQTLQMFSTD